MNTMSKLLMALAATAGLGGCAVYPAPGYGAYESYGTPYGTGYSQPYFVDQSPTYIYGGTTYQRGHAGHGYRGGRGHRDRDGDGVINRRDRDRDGDGVPNRADARPNNPNRR